jgi:hypothetical protein
VVDDPAKLSSARSGKPPVTGTTGRAVPSAAQRSYLLRGLEQPGGKLPLFDRNGREIARKTVQSCLAHGWCEPWFDNPVKPDWLVCKLTPAGYKAVGSTPPDGPGQKG